jgi:hypothetical protein
MFNPEPPTSIASADIERVSNRYELSTGVILFNFGGFESAG